MSNAKSGSGKQAEESLGAGSGVGANAGGSAIDFLSEPCISAIVPARDEEAVIGACVTSLAEQAEIAEILVVNDQSNDGTVAAVRRAAAEIPKLKLLEAASYPKVGSARTTQFGAVPPKLDVSGCCLRMPMRSSCRARLRGLCKSRRNRMRRWFRFRRSK